MQEYKYLGCILNHKLNENSEIDRITSNFNKVVGMFLRKFSTIRLDVKMKLFNTLCMSLYGLEMVYDSRGCAAALRRLAVSYHYGLKRLLGFPKHFSNHYTCNVLNMFTFGHLRNYRMMKFYAWMKDTKIVCMMRHRYTMIHHSDFAKRINRVFSNVYEVSDVLSNDIDALVSRIGFVQLREPSSSYMYLI